jgi:hypothetical protein
MTKPSSITFNHGVYITDADVELAIENDIAHVQLSDFDATADITIHQDQLQLFTTEQLQWLITCCGLELQTRLS